MVGIYFKYTLQIVHSLYILNDLKDKGEADI